jgi:CopG family transcriptional regulator/antitoxin EndoAI
MSRRINVILPEKTLEVLDRVAPRGNRSRLISDAVMHYVASHGRQRLSERLAEGYQANALRDLAIAQEWFPLEEEACQPRTAARPRRKK